jgi:hypothetical protein
MQVRKQPLQSLNLMNKIESDAADLLLDLGVRIPVRTLRFLDLKKVRHITIRRPYLGTLLKIAKIHCKIGLKHEDMEGWGKDENMQFIADHGKDVSLAVAYGIARGRITSLLFARLIAWWLRWRVHPIYLSEAFFQIIKLTNTVPFQNIILLSGAMNPLKRSH